MQILHPAGLPWRRARQTTGLLSSGNSNCLEGIQTSCDSHESPSNQALMINNSRTDVPTTPRKSPVTRWGVIGAITLVLPWFGSCESASPVTNIDPQKPDKGSPTTTKDDAKVVFARPGFQIDGGSMAGGANAAVRGQASPSESKDTPGTGKPVIGTRETWAVLLTIVPGADAMVEAEQLRARASSAGLRGAFVERRSEGAAVLLGSFGSPAEDDAKASLQRAREARENGKILFPGAVMAAPNYAGQRGEVAAWDLRNVRERVGAGAAKWTLQVGIYGPVDNRPVTKEEIAEFRALSEQAVRALRQDGHDAYYFHGPVRSTVMVGVFGDVTDRSPEVVALKKKLPHNLVNGQEMRRKDSAEAQESFLVAIPGEKSR